MTSPYTPIKSAALSSPGDSVSGVIMSFEDFQLKNHETGELRFYPKSGNPIMGTRIVLEVDPGDEKNRIALWAESLRMIKAVASAVKATGSTDICVGGYLAVTRLDGPDEAYRAEFSKPSSS